MFKVWIHVEQQPDDPEGDHEDIDLPFSAVVSLDTETEAVVFARRLQAYGEWLATQPYY